MALSRVRLHMSLYYDDVSFVFCFFSFLARAWKTGVRCRRNISRMASSRARSDRNNDARTGRGYKTDRPNPNAIQPSRVPRKIRERTGRTNKPTGANSCTVIVIHLQEKRLQSKPLHTGGVIRCVASLEDVVCMHREKRHIKMRTLKR